MKTKLFTAMVIARFLAPSPTVLASTWYVNGVSGSDSNSCISATLSCKTIKHAISLASSGDTIMVAPAIYKENLTIRSNVKITGSSASTTIIDGSRLNTVITIPNGVFAKVILSNVTIRNGLANSNLGAGGGIYSDVGQLTINGSTVTGNISSIGGGISSCGSLTINDSTIAGNNAGIGGGILNCGGTLTINNSTVTSNVVRAPKGGSASGAGISSFGITTINNSTISGNSASAFLGLARGGGIENDGTLKISNSTVSGNNSRVGGGIYGTATLQNSIIANNSGGNCDGSTTSNGYNLSSDGTCNFNKTGDLNNTNPLLGTLGNYGGPTQTIPLLSGSQAIDAGNPSGCTSSNGVLLKTDQRGYPRPDPEDIGGCDMGAYERQGD